MHWFVFLCMIICAFAQDCPPGQSFSQKVSKASAFVRSLNGDISVKFHASDSSGNIYIGGEFNGDISFWDSQNHASRNNDLYIIKLNPTLSSVLWALFGGTSSGDTMEALTIHSNRIYMTSFLSVFGPPQATLFTTTDNGTTAQLTIPLLPDGEEQPSSQVSTLFQIDSNTGEIINNAVLRGDSAPEVSKITFDSMGNVYLAGLIRFDLIYRDVRIVDLGVPDGYYLLKVNSTLDAQWVRPFPVDLYQLGVVHLLVDPQQVIHMMLNLRSTVNLANVTIFATDSEPTQAIVKCDSQTGNFSQVIQLERFPDVLVNPQPYTFRMDPYGYFYIIGVDYDEAISVSETQYIVKMNPSGNIEWYKLLPGGGQEKIQSIVYDDRYHSLHVFGHFKSFIFLDAKTQLFTKGLMDLFLAQYGVADGELQDYWTAGTNNTEEFVGATFNSISGKMDVIGTFTQPLDLDGNLVPRSIPGSAAIPFVAQFEGKCRACAGMLMSSS